MLATAAWKHARDMASIGRHTRPRPWPSLPQDPDVSYDLVQNRVVITAAFLQPPVFDPNGDSAQHFGALGALIGHQLNYAFDSKGRTIDPDGQLRDWWTPADGSAYEARTTPIIDQYNAYSALGMVKVNGQQTKQENLADLAGVELALDAFKAASAAQPLAKVGSATPEQRFFEAYATVWQRVAAPDTLVTEVSTAIQAPAKYRVDGPLANLPEFGKTYACKTGQPMLLKTPVGIWR